MLFPSVAFLAYFFPLFLVVYFALPWRNAIFLLFSFIFFYWGEDKYIGVLIGYIAINYLFGMLMGRSTQPARRRFFLAIGVAGNLILLYHYKYLSFTLTTVLPDLFGIELTDVHLPHLPLGISYFTFHGISYLVDVYRGVTSYSSSLLNVALYISMFPHMVAGPIVRYHTIARALVRRCVTLNRVLFSVRLFVIGLAQKMLIANNVGAAADAIFDVPVENLNTVTAWVGGIAYTLQIYFDFCGYSLMAIGIGILLGFRLPRNFRYPYISQSVTEFWRRWHISLSTWFRDYLYIPLGGNRRGQVRTLINLATVFVLCGLWHGAAYTFLCWGIFHGLLLIVERMGWGRVLTKLPRYCRHLYTLLAVMVGWIIFRAETMAQACDFLTALVGLNHAPGGKTLMQITTHGQQLALLLGLLLATPLLETGAKRLTKWGRQSPLSRTVIVVGTAWRTISLGVLFILSYIYILAGSYSPFLYFRF